MNILATLLLVGTWVGGLCLLLGVIQALLASRWRRRAAARAFDAMVEQYRRNHRSQVLNR